MSERQRDSATERRSHVAGVTETVAELLRTFDQARAAMLQDVDEGVESTGHVLLRLLQENGPMRSGELAETLSLDPSTVSRRIAGLVKTGFVERQADPEDGRACILVPTRAGRGEVDDNTRRRIDFFDQILAEWDADAVARFDQMLTRFAAGYAAAHQSWLAERHHRDAQTDRVGASTAGHS